MIIIMLNLAPVLENEIHKLLWDFNIQTDPLISTTRPYNNQQKNKTKKPQKTKKQNKNQTKTKQVNLQNSGLYCTGWAQNKTERKWKER